jgi:hypothetical protein
MSVCKEECDWRGSMSVLGDGFLITLSLLAKRRREREVFKKCSIRHIQEMEPNRYRRVLERLLLCLSTQHVVGSHETVCTARRAELWPASREIKQNKAI